MKRESNEGKRTGGIKVRAGLEGGRLASYHNRRAVAANRD
jgi:hypothetical protein